MFKRECRRKENVDQACSTQILAIINLFEFHCGVIGLSNKHFGKITENQLEKPLEKSLGNLLEMIGQNIGKRLGIPLATSCNSHWEATE